MIRLTEVLHIVHVRGFPGLVEPLEFGKNAHKTASCYYTVSLVPIIFLSY